MKLGGWFFVSWVGVLLTLNLSACSDEACSTDDDCSNGQICVEGKCQDPDSQHCPEVPCSGDTLCYDGRCVDVNCENRDCPEGWGCVFGHCEDPACAKVDCEDDEACAGGACYPLDCDTHFCPGLGEVCVDEQCQAASCLDLECPDGEACAWGHCYPKDCVERCEGAADVCYENSCMVRSCVGMICPADQVCAYGYCYPMDCPSTACQAWEVCQYGECMDESCVDVICPAGTHCALEQCWPEDCVEQACASGQVCVDEICTGLVCIGGRCDDPCLGVVCDVSPAGECLNASVLLRYAEEGLCAEDVCSYAAEEEICERGCEDGHCLGLCDDVVCDDPPDDECVDGNTVRMYEAEGTCSEGECSYDFQDQNCPDGCELGACLGPCHGVTCEDPPTDSCVDASTLRAFEPEGACVEGECEYQFNDVVCDEGCVEDHCFCSDECEASTSGCAGEVVWDCLVQDDGCWDYVEGQDCSTLQAGGQAVFTCAAGDCRCRHCCNLAGQCPNGVDTTDCPGGLCCPSPCGSTGETALYVTQDTYSGSLGGRSGADAICVANKPADLSCTQIHAFLSVNGSDEIRDMPSNYGYSSNLSLYFYNRSTRALTQFAGSWPDALDSSIEVTPIVGLGCCTTSLHDYWTGSYNDGSHALSPLWDYTCDGWSSLENLGMQGEFGSDTNWIRGPDNMITCASTSELYLLCACRL